MAVAGFSRRAALLLPLLGVAGCRRREPGGSGTVGKGASQGRTVRFAVDSPPQALDPATADANVFSIVSNVCEGLVGFDRGMKAIPLLATSWQSPDDHTWVLQLRQSVLFHDGQPLTPQAVKASLDAARSGTGAGERGFLASVAGVEIQSPTSLVITTSGPDPLLLSNLVQVPVYRRDAEGSLVGTGPYRLVSFDSKAVVLTAFPRYWGGAAALPSVHFVMTKRGEDTLAALRSGSIDLAEIPPRAVVEKPRPKFQVAASDGLRSVYLFLDSRPYEGNPISERRVREALSLGLDRPELARIVTGHAETAATQLVPPTVFGFVPELKLPPRDVAAARLLLADAGFPRGFAIPLVCRPEESDVAQAIARNLKEIGIEVSLELHPYSEILQILDEQPKRRALVSSGWSFDGGDAGSFLRDVVHGRDAARGFGLSNFGFQSDVLDRAIEEMLVAETPAARRSSFERAMTLALREVPALPLFHVPLVYGIAPDLVFEPRLDGRLLAHEMRFRAPRNE